MNRLILILIFLHVSIFASESTVRLRYERQKDGETITGHGTAFAIGKRILLTTAHNINGKGESYSSLKIEVKDKWVSCHVVISDERKDVCVLEIDVDMPMLKLADDEPKIGAKLVLEASARGEPIKKYSGKLVHKFKSGFAWHEMKIEFDHGMSGGPVLDQTGKVVGMAVAGTPKDDDLDHETGLYVPLIVIRAFLEENNYESR